ncbi:MAG: LPXTG cell wall anchor domain-containing protein [Candidatus Altiarchaeales archaeon]|nr:LPXTG cell wall anchor domain-containing protein [Candidatus Altiarchaeales archaeon]
MNSLPSTGFSSSTLSLVGVISIPI